MAKTPKPRAGIILVPKNVGWSTQMTADVAKQLRLRERATEAGRQNLPATSERGLDEAELQVLDQRRAYFSSITQQAKTAITDATNVIRAKMIRAIEPSHAHAVTKRHIRELKDSFAIPFETALKDKKEKERQLNAFEVDHGLPKNSAVYGRDKLMHYSSLGALTIAEGAANAFFIQDMQTYGLVGGFFLAGSVSVANVAAGAGAGGIGLRLLRHRKTALRLIGAAATIIFTTASLSLLLALAKIRDLGAMNPGAAFDFLVVTKPSEWFNYSSLPPAILFLFGAGTYLVAMLKSRGGAMGVVTPYWGHDQVDRRFRESEEELQRIIENIKLSVFNAYDADFHKLRQQHEVDAQTLIEIRDVVASAEAEARIFRDSIEHEIARVHALLRLYRELNQQVRDTPPPTYFSSYPPLDEWRAERVDLSELQELAEQAERSHRENAQKLIAIEEQMTDLQAATIDQILAALKKKVEEAERGDGVSTTKKK